MVTKDVLSAFGSFCSLASACCAVRAAQLVTPFQSTASEKTARLIRMLRDYAWASRDVVVALKPIVHDKAAVADNFETYRLTLANAIRQYLDGSERAERELKSDTMLDFTPEIMSTASARSWLWLAVAAALVSTGFQLGSIWMP